MSDDKLFHKRSMPPKGKRPVLPETTPSPALAGGRTNAYSTMMEPRAKSSADVNAQTDSIDYRRPSEVALNRLVTKLPIDIRENVSGVVAMALTDSAIARRSMADISNEMLLLRAELKKKTAEQEQANQRCAIYADRLNIMEQKMSGLQDNIETHQKFSFRSKRAVNRLSTTNRMLIDAFEALQTGHQSHKNSAPSLHNDQSSPVSLQSGVQGSTSETSSFMQANGNPAKNTTQNDKLRESLLRIAREHYKTVRMAETLELKVDELQGKLKVSDGKAKDMETELFELRDLNAERLNSGDYVRPSQQDEGNQLKIKSIRETQDVVDEKLKRLLERNAFDPVDGLTQLRRLLAIFEGAPTALHTLETAFYLCSRYICKVFDVEMMSFYLYYQKTLTRYSTGKMEVEMYHLHEASETSVVQEILKTGQPMRLNSMKEGRMPAVYNPDIDGADGISVKKLLAVPIQDRRNKVTFGVLTFINKSRNPASSSFSELDEIFATMYAEHASTLLSACILYRNLHERSDLLTSLLESSTSLFKAVPDPKSLAANKVLRVEDILFTLENVARDVLKCSKVRAIFLSEYCNGTSGKLIALEAASRGKKPTYTTAKSMLSAPASSGIAGRVISSKQSYIAYDVEEDSVFNPAIDLEAVESKMLTVPIGDLYGTVIACLQLVPGPTSPKFIGHTKDDNSVTFEEAAEWLVHQVTTPLSFLMKNVGQSSVGPLMTPKAITAVDLTSSSRLSLLPKDYFEDKNQLTVVTEDEDSPGSGSPLPTSKMRNHSLSGRPRTNPAELTPFGAKSFLPRTPSGIIRTTFTVVETFHHEEDSSSVSSVPSSPRHVPVSKPIVQVPEGVGLDEHNRVKGELAALKELMGQMMGEGKAKEEKTTRTEMELASLTKALGDLQVKNAYQEEEMEKMRVEHREAIKRIGVENSKHAKQIQDAFDLCMQEKRIVQEQYQQALAREELSKQQLGEIQELHIKSSKVSMVEEDTYKALEQKYTEVLAREHQLQAECVALQKLVHDQQKVSSAHRFELERMRDDIKLFQIENENENKKRSHSILVESDEGLVPILTLTGHSEHSTAEQLVSQERISLHHEDSSKVAVGAESKQSPAATVVVPTPSATDLLDVAMKAPDGPKDDWLEMKDADGGSYYYNHVTGESNVHPPRTVHTPHHPPLTPHRVNSHDEVAPETHVHDATGHNVAEAEAGYSATAALVDGDWTRYYDETVDRYYWYNSISEESEWDDGTGQRESLGLHAAYGAGYEEDASPYSQHGNGSQGSFSTNVSATAGGYTIEL